MGFSKVTCEHRSHHFIQAERFNVSSWIHLVLVLLEALLVTAEVSNIYTF